jgi:MFS family permease
VTDPRHTGIAAAILVIAFVGVALSLTIPLLSLEMERMGISGTWIGLNTAIAGLASILVLPFVPRLAALVGVGRMLASAIVVVIATLLLFRWTYSFWLWFPIRFVFSIAVGVLFVLSEFWIATLAPPERRGLVMGLYATVLALGFAAGPAILAVVGTTGWAPYLAGAGLMIVAALPLLLARQQLPKVEKGSRRPLWAYLVALPLATSAGMVFGGVESGGFALLPVYGLRIGFGAEQAALLVSVLALGNVLLQLPIGLAADRVDKGALLVLIALLGAAGALAIPFLAEARTSLMVLLFVWGGVVGGLYTVGLSHLSARFAGADLAGANTAFVVLYNVGLMLGPPAVGVAMDMSNPHGFAWCLAAMFGLILLAGGATLLRR